MCPKDQIKVQQGLDLHYLYAVAITVIRGTLTISGDYKQSVSYGWLINELHHKISSQEVQEDSK